MKRTRATLRLIRQMAREIARRFDPEKVILFGSHARGEANGDSDVDLLVILPVEGSRREKQVAIRLALRRFKVAKDIIVTTPRDFEWRKDLAGTIERPADREGLVLYAKG